MLGTSASPTLYEKTLAALHGSLHLSLIAKWRIQLVEASRRTWSAEDMAYGYTVEDAEARELFAYHWHPGRPGVPFPYLHLGPALGALQREATRAHLPTGVVGLADVLLLLIRDFGVTSLRPDWRTILSAGVAR